MGMKDDESGYMPTGKVGRQESFAIDDHKIKFIDHHHYPIICIYNIYIYIYMIDQIE